MKRKHGYFAAVYNSNGRNFDIQGSYTIVAGKDVTLSSEDDVISSSFWITEIVNGFSTGPKHRGAYIRENSGAWQIGDIINQQFRSQTSDFLNWLKTTIVSAYENSNSDDSHPEFISEP